MAEYKRIQQLKETTNLMPNDYFAVDKEGSAETNKISKANLFEGYLKTPDLEESYPTKTWARRGGQWTEIFPDYYLVEANKDGKLYARKDGQWVVIGEDGLNGDMYAFTYDQRGQRTDIFDLIQKISIQPNLVGKTFINGGTKLIGNFLNSEFIFKEGLQNFIYVDAPKELKILKKVKVFKSKNDIFANKTFTFGSYQNTNINDRTKILKSIFCVPVEKDQILKLKNIGTEDIKINFIKTDQTNKFIGDLTVSANGQNTKSTVFSDEVSVTFLNTGYLGIELSFGKIQEDGEFIISDTMVENWSISYDRYRMPLLGSLDNDISITEIEVLKESSPDLPVEIDLLQNKIITHLKTVSLSYPEWTFENSANGYVIAYAKLPENTAQVYVPGYETVKEVDLLKNTSQCAIKAMEGESYIYIVTQDTNMYNEDFSLDVRYQKDEEILIQPFIIEDGSYQIITQSFYADSTNFGNIVISQNAVIDYFLRNSGGKISGNLEIDGDLQVNSKILAKTIKDLESENKIELNDKISIQSPENNIELKAQNILIENNLNTNIKTKNLIVESEARPTINEQEILIEKDFTVDENNSNQKDWTPQVKTSENFGNRKNIVNEEYLNKFFSPRNGQNLIDNGQDNLLSNYKLDSITGINIDIEENLKLSNESANRVLILDTNKKVSSSNITAEELGALSGIDTSKSLQSQLDSIPKYNYLSGQTIIIHDENISGKLPPDVTLETATQEQIDKAILDYAKEQLNLGNLFEITYIPKQWDAIALRLERYNLETFKDALFFYDQTVFWTFLYYLSTTISRADGTQAGIVENSPDISWADGKGQVAHAEAANRWTEERTFEISGILSGNTKINGSKDLLLELNYNYQNLDNGIDLNTLNNPIYAGLYKTPTEEISSSILNSPTTALFELEIKNNGLSLKQEISEILSNKKWNRVFYNQIWSEWAEFQISGITEVRGRLY